MPKVHPASCAHAAPPPFPHPQTTTDPIRHLPVKTCSGRVRVGGHHADDEADRHDTSQRSRKEWRFAGDAQQCARSRRTSSLHERQHGAHGRRRSKLTKQIARARLRARYEGGRIWLGEDRRRSPSQSATPKWRGPPGDADITGPAAVVAVRATRTVVRNDTIVDGRILPPLIPAIFAFPVPDPIVSYAVPRVLASVCARAPVALTFRSVNVETLQENGRGALKRRERKAIIFEI